MEKRTCPECGAEFAPNRSAQRYCSDNCSRNADAAREAARDHQFEAERLKEKRERERRRAEFFAARDEEFARIGLPPPRITVNADGTRTEHRGRSFGSWAQYARPVLTPVNH